MSEERVADSLFAVDVLTVRAEDATTTQRFESLATEYTPESGTTETLEPAVGEVVGRAGAVGALTELAAMDARVLGELRALAELLDEPTTDQLLSVLPTIWLFRDAGEPHDGVPESFVPIPGPWMPALAQLYPRTLFYVWLEDCSPCETVRTDLEALFAEPRGVMTFAVYGPAHRAFLLESYDVNAGPALLFMRDGRVDVRLYGAQPRGTLEAELETLCR